jgi:hypothetical protein
VAWYTYGLAHRLLVAFLWTALAVRRVPLSRMVGSPGNFRPNTVQLLAFSSLTDMISSTVQLVLVLLEAAVSAEAERGTLNSRAG